MLRSDWKDVTPALATSYLGKNKAGQRPVSLGRVTRYAQAMMDGKWLPTNQGIGFDKDGNLLDGQHRLLAVVESGVTIRALVVHGLDPEAFKVVDSGGTRGSKDLYSILYESLHNRKPKNAQHCASVAYSMIQKLDKSCQPSAEEVATYACERHGVIESFLEDMKKNACHTTSVVAAFCDAGIYFGQGRMQVLTERFGTQLWTGAKDPLKALHDRLMRAKIKELRTSGLDKVARYGLALSAIRACLSGDSRERLECTEHVLGTAGDKTLKNKRD